MNWNLKSGIIVIGSLLWQDHAYEKGDEIRLNWRKSKLDLENKIPVKVPIRYGRISSSQIPTMVFSNSMSRKLGFGYVTPLKSLINNSDQLICEAMALSTAEGMKGNFSRSWGVLTYLFNEGKINQDVKKEIIKCFRNKNHSVNPEDYKIKGERACVTKSLKLDISWIQTLDPKDQEKLNQFDLLLATATRPEKNKPSIGKLAEKINADNSRRYFFNNITHGIISYDDFEIANKLK